MLAVIFTGVSYVLEPKRPDETVKAITCHRSSACVRLQRHLSSRRQVMLSDTFQPVEHN